MVPCRERHRTTGYGRRWPLPPCSEHVDCARITSCACSTHSGEMTRRPNPAAVHAHRTRGTGPVPREPDPGNQPPPKLAISRRSNQQSAGHGADNGCIVPRKTAPLSRYLAPRLREALADTPAVLIHGPRQSGKTTLARLVGESRGYRYVSFDDQAVLGAARRDPIGFVAGLARRTILDEVQRVPEIFTSIKGAIDRRRTGTVSRRSRTQSVLAPAWSSTPGTQEFDTVSHLVGRTFSTHSEDPSHLFAHSVALLGSEDHASMGRPFLLETRVKGEEVADVVREQDRPSAVAYATWARSGVPTCPASTALVTSMPRARSARIRAAFTESSSRYSANATAQLAALDSCGMDAEAPRHRPSVATRRSSLSTSSGLRRCRTPRPSRTSSRPTRARPRATRSRPRGRTGRAECGCA